MDHFKEVDLEFVIRRCHIGDETRLSLLGKATFLETYADSTQAADLLAFVETEHSIERYRFWLESRFARPCVAEAALGRSAIGYAVTQHGFGPRDGDQATLCVTPLPPTRLGTSIDE